jgi:hypothetical protein
MLKNTARPFVDNAIAPANPWLRFWFLPPQHDFPYGALIVHASKWPFRAGNSGDFLEIVQMWKIPCAACAMLPTLQEGNENIRWGKITMPKLLPGIRLDAPELS